MSDRFEPESKISPLFWTNVSPTRLENAVQRLGPSITLSTLLSALHSDRTGWERG